MAQPLLVVNQVETFYGRIRALKDVSLTVDEGQVVALLGANGAGKTTTLRTICGLVHPTRGTVEFAGQRVDRVSAERLVSQGMAHSPEGRQVFPQLTVWENLRLGAYTRRDKTIDTDIERVFHYFPHLKERVKQLAGTLSGGEQQML